MSLNLFTIFYDTRNQVDMQLIPMKKTTFVMPFFSFCMHFFEIIGCVKQLICKTNKLAG